MPEETQTQETTQETQETQTQEQTQTQTVTDKPWIDHFPEEAKTDPTFNRYKTPADLYKGLKEKEAFIGRKGLIIPNANSKPEEVSAFIKSLPENIRKEMGWPEKPEGYKFTMPENLHKELGMTPEALKPWQDTFHKLGLTQAQADGILGAYMQLGNASFIARDNQRVEAAKKADIALRNDPEWAGQKYDENMQLATTLLVKTGGEPLAEMFSKLEDDNPLKVPLIKALAKIGKNFVEGGVKGLGFSSLNMDSQGASAKIKEILDAALADKNHPYVNASHPEHKKLRAEVDELYKIANG